MHRFRALSCLLLTFIILSGCASSSSEERLTLGTVQATLHEGLTQSEVQAAMGPPNIISKDPTGREVWTYDKVWKQTTGSFLLFWSSARTSERTLTVLITFDGEGRLKQYTYHSMEF